MVGDLYCSEAILTLRSARHSSKPLRFAYSCCYLILTRRTLKFLFEESSKEPGVSNTFTDETNFVKVAIDHARNILTLFLELSELTDFVRPAYENLLTSFAMVTLSEFAMYVDDLDATLVLMEKSAFHIQLGGKAEPVSKWSLDVLRKYIADVEHSKKTNDDSTLIQHRDVDVRSRMGRRASANVECISDANFEGFDQDFPTLEDMFLGI